MFPSTMAPKWSILVSQCEMDQQKPTILLNFGTLSLGGCWGHPMRPKLNLNDKGQISRPDEYTDNFKSNLTCIFLSVRAKLKKNPLCARTLIYQKRRWGEVSPHPKAPTALYRIVQRTVRWVETSPKSKIKYPKNSVPGIFFKGNRLLRGRQLSVLSEIPEHQGKNWDLSPMIFVEIV